MGAARCGNVLASRHNEDKHPVGGQGVGNAVADHSGPWTVDDVLALPEDTNHRIELVGGAMLMSPNAGIAHQRASSRLAALLDTAITASAAPFEVLEAVNIVVHEGLLIPGLVVADAAAAADANTTLSAHDIVVAIEIASPSTQVTDKKMKPSLYAAAGIAHYWRLELDPAPRLYLGHLERGTYVDRLVQAGQTTGLDDPGIAKVYSFHMVLSYSRDPFCCLAGDVLKGWPAGMRLIMRKERPHPGAQLRFTDADGMRLTCFATNTTGTAIAALELRHR